MIGGKNRSQARCQCDPSCLKPPLTKDNPFCKDHQNCARFSPPSGWEPEYNPEPYHATPTIKNGHNCFAYALDLLSQRSLLPCRSSSCNVSFPQPGEVSKHQSFDKTDGKRCPDIIARTLGDIKGSKQSNFIQACPAGMRKIAFAVDPTKDYHVYRQDKPIMKNGKPHYLWSHKPGSTEVTQLDSMGNFIHDPALASRNNPESKLNYRHFCGYMCIPVIKKGGRSRKKASAMKKKRTRRARRAT